MMIPPPVAQIKGDAENSGDFMQIESYILTFEGG
jgi:hypothetical protein